MENQIHFNNLPRHHDNLFPASPGDSANLFEALFEANPLPAWVYDLETLKFIAVNQAALAAYGYSREEFLEIGIRRINPFSEIFDFQNGETGNTENPQQHQTKEGSIINVKVNSYSFVSQKERPVRLVLVREMTQPAKTGEIIYDEKDLLHILMDKIPDTIYFKDTASRFIKINQAQAETLGGARAEEVVGKTDFDFFNFEHAQAAFEDEQNIIASRQSVIGKVERIKLPGGKIRWVTATKVPLINAQGKVIGIAGISRDITEQKQADDRLRIFNEKLQQSNRELQDFAYVASHDLQEPLRKVRAFSDRLARKYSDKLGEEGIRYLERMCGAAARMQILIEDLLTFSRVTTKAKPFQPVNLSQIAGEVISDLEVKIEETGASVEIKDLPVIEADPVQMRQLMQNLIGNAIKFRRPDASPQVKVYAEFDDMSDERDAENPLCRIIIRDNGIGFDEKYTGKIFTVFQRLHGRGEYEGSGVGLAVCRKIVERHGGTLGAKSRPGEGASFIITIPVKQTREEVNQ